MKTVALAAIIVGCASFPALAQGRPDEHSAHHEPAPAVAQQGVAQQTCPNGTSTAGISDVMMQHMSQMDQMMKSMRQMHTEMQAMHQQMMQMRQGMQPRR